MAIRLAAPAVRWVCTSIAQPGLVGVMEVATDVPLTHTLIDALVSITSSSADAMVPAGTSNECRNSTRWPLAGPSEYQIAWVPLKKSPPPVGAAPAFGHQPES